MGIEKIQSLPDARQESAAGVLFQTIGVLLCITVAAFWAATQYAAWKLAFQPALGEPLLRFKSWALYVPTDFFMWLLQFGHVEGTEEAFNGGEWIITSLHFLVLPAIWMAVRRAKKLTKATDTHGSARWAEVKDIQEAGLLPRPQSLALRFKQELPKWFGLASTATKPAGASGCYVGAFVDPKTGAYHYLTHDGPEHILAFAPTRSGKGVGLVLPTLLAWPHSTMVHDLKGEAWALTAGYRRAKGHKVLKFAPSLADGTSVRFNPLDEVRVHTPHEVADAQNIALMIVDPDGKGMDDHWSKTGHELLSAGILHICYTGRKKTLPGLVSFFCDPRASIDQIAESMLNCEHDPEGVHGWIDPNTGKMTKTHPMVAEAARSFLNKSENERSGVQSTAMSFLSLYRDPIIAHNVSASEFSADDVMNADAPVDLYLVVPPPDQSRIRPLIRLVITQILRKHTEKMEFANGRSVAGYKHRLLALMDKFPQLRKLQIMEDSLAFMAGYGIKAYLICQDLTQLTKAYSKDESVISNCHIRIAYAPNKIETAELLSKYTGVTTVRKATRSYSGSRLNPFLMHVMAAEQETQRPLLTADECLRIPGPEKSPDGSKILVPGDMLILPAGAPPIWGKQILYFKDPVFDGRSRIPAPERTDAIRPAPGRRPWEPPLQAVGQSEETAAAADLASTAEAAALQAGSADEAQAKPVGDALPTAAEQVAQASGEFESASTHDEQPAKPWPFQRAEGSEPPAAPPAAYTDEELAVLAAEAAAAQGGGDLVEVLTPGEANGAQIELGFDAESEAPPAPAAKAEAAQVEAPAATAAAETNEPAPKGDDLLDFEV